MFSKFSDRLTYANIVSSVCLFLVLGGGTAVALTGTNTVLTDDIKNGEVRNPDLRNGAVSNAKLGNNSVNGGKVAAESLGGGDLAGDSVMGDDVNEGSFGQVPTAAFATNAGAATTANSAGSANSATTASNANNAAFASNSDRVDGLHARTLSWDVAEGASGKTLMNLHGLRLYTDPCPTGDASGSFRVLVNTDTSNSFLRGTLSQNDDFDAGVVNAVKGDSDSDGSGMVVYHRATGGVLTINLAWSKTATRCYVFGTAVGGSGTQDVP